ncbi:MAG: glutathione metabolism protein [Betaproteobacteria bacterium]|nr:MAG: glutathione metabolism protein [Betaproteobacteria bacterium]
MTIALFCIVLAALMPIACAGIAKWGAFGTHPRDGGFDNRNPRDWLAKQEGYRKWANFAQANCWEALPFFAAAVIVNHMLGGAGVVANALAVAFIALRALFVYLYVTGKQGVRSMVWTAALAVNLAIFFLTVVK